MPILSDQTGGLINQEGSFLPSNSSEFKDQQVLDPVSPSAIAEQLTMEEVFEPIENSLRGRKWDFVKKEYVSTSNPLLSDEGIEDILRWLRSYFHKGFNLTNFTEEDVCNIMRRVCFSIIYKLAANFEVYKINKENLDPIMDLIEHNIFASIKMPLGEGHRKYIAGMQRMHITESRSQAVNDAQSKKSFLGNVFRRGY